MKISQKIFNLCSSAKLNEHTETALSDYVANQVSTGIKLNFEKKLQYNFFIEKIIEENKKKLKIIFYNKSL